MQKKRDNFVTTGRDDDDDDDDNPLAGGDSPPASPGIPRPPVMRDFFPDDYNNPFNVNLNNLEQEYWARDIEIEKEREPPIQSDTNLKEIFPDADEILEVNGNHYTGIESYNRQQFFPYRGRIKQPEIKTEIQFFNGGSEGADILLERLHTDDRIRGNEQFVSFLTSESCRDALQRDNISIHVPTGDIFVNNQNMQESIYTFLDNQQDETKKDIPLDFSYDDDLNDYMTKYLPSINDYDEVKYDFLANKNSKFLFNLFNKNQEINGRKKLAVKHTKISADDYALRKLQDRNWPYFVNRIIEFSQGVFDINDIITADPEEVNILNNTRSKIYIMNF